MAIHEKLLSFQKQNITITKDGANPHYRSKYATLSEVLEKVSAPLNELGVLIEQRPEMDGLRTVLTDTEDGTSVEGFIPFIGAADMQKLGSAITYARRYSLVSMLGLEAEDDDGNAASAPAKTAARPVNRPAPRGPVQSNDEPFPSSASEIPTVTFD